MNALLAGGLSNAVVASVLALVAAGVTRWWRRPALVHGLWLLVLLKLVTPPLLALPLPTVAPWPPTPTTPPETVIAFENAARTTPEEVPAPEMTPLTAVLSLPNREESEPPAESTFSWTALLGGVWLTTSGLWFTVAVGRVRRFGRLLAEGRAAPDEVQAEARALARRLGLRRTPVVWLVPGTVSPLLWAFGGPARLLLPSDLLRRLEPGQQTTLLAHELAHYRRRDHWVRGLEMVATGLFWWHPVVWWARHRLREAEEQCCDAWVVWALPDAARNYAHALMNTLDFLSGVRPALPPGASAAGHFPLLKRRLTMIVQRNAPRSLSPAAGLLMAALALAVLPWSVGGGQAQERTVPAAVEVDAPKTATDRAREELEKARARVREAEALLQRLEKDKETRKTAVIRLWELAPVVREVERIKSLAWAADGKVLVTGMGDGPPSPPVAFPAPPPGPDAKQAVAVLEAQLAAKKAAVDEAEALLEKTKRRAERLRKLAATGAAQTEDADDAVSDLKIHEAQLRGKKAELQEVEVRLAGEKARLEQSGRPMILWRTAPVAPRPATPEERKADPTRPEVAPPTPPAPPAPPADPRKADVEKFIRELRKTLEKLESERDGQKPAEPRR